MGDSEVQGGQRHGSPRRPVRAALGLLLGLASALANPVVVSVTAATDKTCAGKAVPWRAEALNAASNACTWSVWEAGREVPGVFAEGVFHAPEADTTRLYRVRATSVHDGKARGEATIVVLSRNEGTSHLFKALAGTGWSRGYGPSCSVADLPFLDTETMTRYDPDAKMLLSMDPTRPTQVVGCFVTTGHSLVELAEADLERSVAPFSVLSEPGQAAGHGGILRAKARVPRPLTLQWFDGRTTPPSFTWTATCVPKGSGAAPVKLAEGHNQGRNLVDTQVTFPEPGIMDLRLQCVTEQGVTEHAPQTVIVDQ